MAALRQTLRWAERLAEQGRLGEAESLILQIASGEYLAQLAGGIAISQGETVRPDDMNVPAEAQRAFDTPAVRTLAQRGNTNAARMRLAALIGESGPSGHFGDLALDDETLEMVRDQFHRFAEEKIVPYAHGWHSRDELIPMSVVEDLAGLGVFGLTVPEENGGLGMGKVSMCVVTEELARAYIGVGSLGTRSEIAAELIRIHGTAAQKEKWLPLISSGEVLPTAVFTEPNTGSDLASLRTRAIHSKDADGADVYKVTGNKTWITHPVRADVMTLLARTNPDEPGYKGLSMLLAEKPRGSDADPFPAAGMTGGEIEVLGYRGMKEYEIAFDGFEVKAANLLGGEEGQGFKQLMQTFESARIQTAARAVGVAQNASSSACNMPRTALQFGKAIVAFPRVSDKLVMAVETMVARQLTYYAAREKDSRAGAATSRPAWPSCSPPASPGRPPTTRCRFTAATASRWNSR